MIRVAGYYTDSTFDCPRNNRNVNKTIVKRRVSNIKHPVRLL